MTERSELTELGSKPLLGCSFGMRGRGDMRRKWAGKWYKPWTWRRYVYVIEEFDLVSIDLLPPPKQQ
jgi:hypothetical protein